MNIKQMFLTPNEYSRPGEKLVAVKAIVIHWVANPNSSALATRNYFEGLKVKGPYASAHYAISLDGEIIQCIPDDEMAYHVGSNTYTGACLDLLGDYPNNCSIGIELNHTDWEGRFTPATLKAAAELTATLCKKYNLSPIYNVWTHQEVVGWKDCPRWFVKHPDEWEDFKREIEKIYLSMNKPVQPAPQPQPEPPKYDAPQWAINEVLKAKANGILKSDHDPNEKITMGVLCTMLNNMMDQLKK